MWFFQNLPSHHMQIFSCFQEPGIVKCQKRPERFKDCQVVLGPGGELSCENEQPLLGYCDINRNIVRLPENFQRDTAPCPNDFSCRPAWNSLKNIKHQFISDLVCGEAKNSICLPDNGKTLTSLYNLLRSFELPKTACRRNPCPRGMAPTIEDGYYRWRCPPSKVCNVLNIAV